jgi:plasmid stabilization system protein ParE
MRKIILAPSFDAEFLALAVHIEGRFGEAAANAFEDRFRSLAVTLSYSPLIGTTLHGYPTTFHGFVMAPC